MGTFYIHIFFSTLHNSAEPHLEFFPIVRYNCIIQLSCSYDCYDCYYYLSKFIHGSWYTNIETCVYNEQWYHENPDKSSLLQILKQCIIEMIRDATNIIFTIMFEFSSDWTRSLNKYNFQLIYANSVILLWSNVQQNVNYFEMDRLN